MKGRWPLALQLALGFTLIVAVALGGGGAFLHQRLQTQQVSRRTEDVLAKARAAVTEVQGMRIPLGPAPALTQALYTFQQQSGVRPVLVNADGLVIGDSWSPSPLLNKPLPLPEVEQALAGKEATGARRLESGEVMLYAAVPLIRNQAIFGAVLVSADITDLDRGFREMQGQMIWVLVAAGVFSSLLGWALARWLSRPLERVNRATAAIASGELDVTVEPGGSAEVAALGERFNAMATELRRLEAQRRHFVAAASHEMRTPVASVRALAEALVNDTDGDIALYKEYLGDILKECEHAGHLVDRMLELARLEGRVPVSGASFALGDVVSECVDSLQPVARSRGIALSFTGQGQGRVAGEAWVLETVVDNLVENALKYTPSGGEVAVTVCDGEITVADTGPGIPEEHLPHLFERFYRVDRSRARATGGVGLGLAIVAEAVAQLGGQIAVESRPGVGTRFVVSLPTR
ncbi:MAG TPA: HAMP domain-containing sensor histidine kinase [Symbiobacteriaceae bacterium]|nr:HAMP domain-containing sensor histidine kinase [Symbiobacteriaceae bacterium]